MLPIRGTMPIQSQKTISEAEQEFVEDWLEQEITARVPTFFSQVDQPGPLLHLPPQLLSEYSPVYFAL